MSVLECKGLKKAYKKGKYVLDDFNLTVEGGKIVGLLGPNGCGKSTLMKLISGLLVADGGEIAVCGEPVGDKSKALVLKWSLKLLFCSASRTSSSADEGSPCASLVSLSISSSKISGFLTPACLIAFIILPGIEPI